MTYNPNELEKQLKELKNMADTLIREIESNYREYDEESSFEDLVYLNSIHDDISASITYLFGILKEIKTKEK